MFFIVAWVLMLLAFLIVPLFLDDQRRKRWWQRVFCQRNRGATSTEETGPQTEAAARADESYHYVLSPAQEEGIRESFLLDKLRLYTMNLSASHIHVSELSGKPSATSSEVVTAVAVVQDSYLPDESDVEAPACLPVTSSNSRECDSTDECSSDGQGGYMDDAAMEEYNGTIQIPLAGQCQPQALAEGTLPSWRQVPNGCAICLGAFEPNDMVTWSSNPHCKHAFHHGCVLDWLKASGRKKMRRRRRQEEQEQSIINYACDPVAKITSFPMLCPFCRQDFVNPAVADLCGLDKKSEAGSDDLEAPTPGVSAEEATTTEVSTERSSEGIVMEC